MTGSFEQFVASVTTNSFYNEESSLEVNKDNTETEKVNELKLFRTEL